MSTYWFKNFCGIPQSDFELLRVPNAGAEFCIHVSLRTMQTGALLGSVLGPLSMLIFKDQRSTSKSLKDAFVDGGMNGALIGAAIGPVITYMSLKNMNSVTLYDRCYRLRFDNQQLWQDRSAVLSAAVGYLSSGSIGLVVGLDLSVILSNLLGNAWK